MTYRAGGAVFNVSCQEIAVRILNASQSGTPCALFWLQDRSRRTEGELKIVGMRREGAPFSGQMPLMFLSPAALKRMWGCQ